MKDELKKHLEDVTKEKILHMHVTPLPVKCEHVWPDNDGLGVKDMDRCEKCGLSFLRYTFTELP
jgi:hypothetical protein